MQIGLAAIRAAGALVLAFLAFGASASFHTFFIEELYSSPDGSVQFIELHEGSGFDGQHLLAGHTLTSTSGATTRIYPFPTNLPSALTANKRVLIATQAFADLGIVTPDYIVPAPFLFPGGGTLNYAGVDSFTYAALPADGVNALYRSGAIAQNVATNFAGQTGSVPLARLLVPDGTSVKEVFSTYPETRRFAMTVEPGKTYVVETADTDGDLSANAIGGLNIYAPDGVSTPPEASVDCTAANGPRSPAVDVNSDGRRCVLRTAPPTAGMQQNKRPVYVQVTRMDPALGGGAQFKIRARDATVYGRWLTLGYDYHIEMENTTADPLCVEVARYPTSGLVYTPGPGWSGAVGISAPQTVPAFGAVTLTVLSGTMVGADSDGALRISGCASPTNLIPGALHLSTYAFDPIGQRYIYFFTSTANEGKTRSTW